MSLLRSLATRRALGVGPVLGRPGNGFGQEGRRADEVAPPAPLRNNGRCGHNHTTLRLICSSTLLICSGSALSICQCAPVRQQTSPGKSPVKKRTPNIFECRARDPAGRGGNFDNIDTGPCPVGTGRLCALELLDACRGVL